VRRVRCLLSTGKSRGHGNADNNRFTDFHYHFGSSVLTTSACSHSRSLPQVQISSPYQLSSACPVCGYQESMPLTIHTPRNIPRLATLSGQLFIHAPGFIWWHRWFPPRRWKQLLNATSCRTLSKVVFRHMIQADLCEVAPKFYYLGSWHADLLYIDRRKCVLSLLKHQAQIILTKISANTYFAECWCCSRIIV
jgi:hypothetical protein